MEKGPFSVDESWLIREYHFWILMLRKIRDLGDTWLIPSGMTRSRQYHESTMVWRNLPLYHLLKLKSTLSRSFCLKRQDKVLEAMVQGQVAPDHGWLVLVLWHSVHQVVLDKISQVSRRSEVGNQKECTLNTWLSAGTSAGTFAVSAGPYINYRAEIDTFFVSLQKKGWNFDPHV